MTTLPLDSELPTSADVDGIADEAVEHGEVFTRRWVVEMILDLVGYTADRDLAGHRLVEPACGAGAFLGVIAQRLSQSCRSYGRPITDAMDAVRAFDLLPRNVQASRKTVVDALSRDGWTSEEAGVVAKAWVRQGDYLLLAKHPSADVIVGNPPYIRLEAVPEGRMRLYRSLWPSMTGRADIYVGFFEAALRSLNPEGKLGFICADRWMRNQYGTALRKLISDGYALDVCVVMHDADAFDEQVAAYPAITVLRRGAQRHAVIADTTTAFGPAEARALTEWISRGQAAETCRTPAWRAARMSYWFSGGDPWPLGSPERLAILKELSDRFPALGDPAAKVRVGIGVATGADKIFLTRDPEVVEADRLLPLVMVRDVTTGTLNWSGYFLVNPWDEAGYLVDLTKYPRLRAYLERHRSELSSRYVARKNPKAWYKTIDKVDVGLTSRPKLLFPDMKLSSHPVLDTGGYYPHHNLYYITSDVWDLEVLGGLLLSKVCEGFVDAYAVKMRGGTLRFQAQYLRRIRVPRPDAISFDHRKALIDAFRRRDVDAATAVALEIYGLQEWPD